MCDALVFDVIEWSFFVVSSSSHVSSGCSFLRSFDVIMEVFVFPYQGVMVMFQSPSLALLSLYSSRKHVLSFFRTDRLHVEEALVGFTTTESNLFLSLSVLERRERKGEGMERERGHSRAMKARILISY